MIINFYKYQGTGNDFIMLDNRSNSYSDLSKNNIEFLCNRRFGIGADGLILIENDKVADFKMVYFNSDGGESTMCGNGGRCVVRFAEYLHIISDKCTFMAIDGLHDAIVEADKIHLKMIDTNQIETENNNCILNTGSPHFVSIVDEDVAGIDVINKARKVRYNSRFANDGINVNFVNTSNNHVIAVRTYERGVEDETLSCGTGVVASAIAAFINENNNSSPVKEINHYLVNTRGGTLEVKFSHSGNNNFNNIWLIGPAEKVFRGEILI